MTPADVARLVTLAGARRDRDLARLDAALVEDRRLAAEIAGLATTAERDRAEGDLPLPQQAARLAWADQCIARARMRRDALARELPALRAAAVRSLGKHRALERILERTSSEAARARASSATSEQSKSAQAPGFRNAGIR